MRNTLLGVLVALWLVPGAAYASDQPLPSPSPYPKEALSDAWWTGPLLAPSANTLPRGHVLVEPYLYDVMQYGQYDRNGALAGAGHTNDLGTLTYIIYGLTDRVGVGLIPTFGYNTSSGAAASSGIGAGDLGVLAQYRLTQYHEGHWFPTTSIAIQENLPTGAYDNLGRPNNGYGGGAYSTKLSLYTQTFAWMPNKRILRLRLNFSETLSGSASVKGVSVFGTSNGYAGTAQPGNSTSLDAAGEYSITRNWVFASDLVYGYSANTRLSGTGGITNLGDSHSFAFAPAFEYSWTPNAGIIAGVRVYPAGRNTGASITPVMAINLVR